MKTFDININLTYKQQFKLTPRHRKPMDAQIKTSFLAKIPVLTDDEFPLAFTVKKYGSRQPKVDAYDKIDMGAKDFRIWNTPIRAFGKVFFKPMRFQWGSVEGVVKTSSEDIQQEVDGFNDRYGVTLDEFHKVAPKAVLLGNSKRATIYKCKKALKNYVFYRGQIWEMCFEPRYTYTKFGLPGDGTGFFIEYADTKGNTRFYFSANERAHAIDVVSKIAKMWGDTDDAGSILHEKQNIIVHRPDLVTPVPKKNTRPED